jgi:hypothetical protein
MEEDIKKAAQYLSLDPTLTGLFISSLSKSAKRNLLKGMSIWMVLYQFDNNLESQVFARKRDATTYVERLMTEEVDLRFTALDDGASLVMTEEARRQCLERITATTPIANRLDFFNENFNNIGVEIILRREKIT